MSRADSAAFRTLLMSQFRCGNLENVIALLAGLDVDEVLMARCVSLIHGCIYCHSNGARDPA